jgi:hypothetical protein
MAAARIKVIKQGKLARVVRKIANQNGLIFRDDGKHAKLTNPENGRHCVLPLNHPGMDTPQYALEKLRETLEEWQVLTKEEFEDVIR